MPEDFEAIQRLTRDLANASTSLTPDEARFLVDAYYMMQEDRIRADHQVRTLAKSGEPHAVLGWLAVQSETLEKQIARALDKYSDSQALGKWARSVVGIGPVITAGLLAHIDMQKAPTVGHIWSFAGLDPTKKWEKGKKRPWNGDLKRLCWLIGESFVKFQNHENDVYGHVYVARKSYEVANNEAGKYADQAAEGAERVGAKTDAQPWYNGSYTAEVARASLLLDAGKRLEFLKQNRGDPGSGVPMLPPAHIHARSKRYAVKLFLAHYHEKGCQLVLGIEPPLPYPIAHLGHIHWIRAA